MEMEDFMKKLGRKLYLVILMLIFLILGFMVRNSSQGILFDIFIMDSIHQSQNDIIFTFMKIISFLGSGTFLIGLILLIIIYSLIKKSYYIAKLLIASTLGSYILNFTLKFIVNRTRPLEFILVEQGGLSFPSGHAMVATSMYLTIAHILSDKHKDKKILIYIGATIIILLMGLSRLFLGVHWPTDIIGGYIMGYLLYEGIINTIE